MAIRLFSIAAIYVMGVVGLGANAHAQERNLPEEVRALAVVCSSGASVGFRGQIEGGIFRLFGKVLEGEGELEVSKSESEFLGSFEDEETRLEARAVYNDCVLGALQIVYNLKRERALGSSESQLLVADPLVRLQPSARFALRVGDSIGLANGGVVAVTGAQKNCSYPTVRISNSADRTWNNLRLSEFLKVPMRESCWVTLYGARSFGENKSCVFSLLYECN